MSTNDSIKASSFNSSSFNTLTPLDTALVDFVYQQEKTPSAALLVAMAMTAHSATQGHVCLPISELINLTAPELQMLNISASSLPKNQRQWVEALNQEDRVDCIDFSRSQSQLKTGSFLVLDQSERLYLPRFFDLEQRLLSQLTERTTANESIDFDLAFSTLNQLFGTSEYSDISADNSLDWQKIAACIALLHNFSVISGGPGTGKTTTVIRLIILLLSQPNIATESIALVAPTGKAAARLSESIASKIPELNLAQAISAKIPTEASTIHRLLGIRQNGQFHYHAGNKLNIDLLIVDEASMVDISLMVRLLEASPSKTKVILLGDKDQLSSVEAGSVLADLCQEHFINQCSKVGQEHLSRLLFNQLNDLSAIFNSASSNSLAFSDCIAELKHSYRFDAKSGIGQLAYAVNAGDTQRSKAVLFSDDFDDVELQEKPKVVSQAFHQDEFQLITQASEHYSEYLAKMDNPAACLQAFNRFRVLTAVKEGPFGSINLNHLIAHRLQQQGKIITSELYYAGLPIMIMQNNYQVNLFNGDIGIFIRLPETGELRVIFDDGAGGYRDIAPALLPKWEPAFVMTVHKSQGSEFDTVAMVLPDSPSPLLTREMLYTGITRAKKTLTLYARVDELQTSISSPTIRYSGLSAYL